MGRRGTSTTSGTPRTHRRAITRSTSARGTSSRSTPTSVATSRGAARERPSTSGSKQTCADRRDSACTLAFQHHPRYDWRPYQKWVDDDGTTQYGGTETEPYIEMFDLLDRAGVDVLLVGHNHIYHRWAPQDGEGNFDPDGVRQFTVGTGGRSLYPVRTEAATGEPAGSPAKGVRRARDDAAPDELRLPVGPGTGGAPPSATRVRTSPAADPLAGETCAWM